MPIRGMCKSGGWHAILLTVAALIVLAGVEPVLLSAPTAHAQGGTVREIKITGNRRVEPETVRSYLKFNEGDAYGVGESIGVGSDYGRERANRLRNVCLWCDEFFGRFLDASTLRPVSNPGPEPPTKIKLPVRR